MALRTKPVRILESDDVILGMLAGIHHRSRSEMLHVALADYLKAHRTDLAQLFEDTQRAIATGDIDAIAAAAESALSAQVDVTSILDAMPS